MLGQVALEEETGKATNGLGFAVVDRGPKELLEIATPRQARALDRADHPRRVPRGVGRDGARRGLRRRRPTATADARRRRLADRRREVVRHQRGRPRLLHRPGCREGEQTLFLVEPGAPGLEIVRTPGFLHDPDPDHHPEIVFRGCRVPDANRIPEGGGEGAKEWFTVERLFIAARCCGAAQRLLDLASAYAQEREAFGSKIADYQGVSFPLADSLTELLAARLTDLPRPHAFDPLSNRKIVHGKVAMAKLYASEMAGRAADRALQILGGRGYMIESPAARFFRELRVDRIWEGTSEIQRLIIANGLFKRGAAPYLGWE